MVRVKICGITNLEDALISINRGADILGFIMYSKSKRYIKPIDVRHITSQLPPFISKVGVFVNENPRNVLEILSYAHLDYAQLHGDETPEDCEYVGPERVIKVFRFKNIEEINIIENYIDKVKAILLDTYSSRVYGGTGEPFDWNIAKAVKERYPELPIILSGGLKPENVREAISIVNPYCVDVSSGVEKAPGRKDPQKISEFIKIAKCS